MPIDSLFKRNVENEFQEYLALKTQKKELDGQVPGHLSGMLFYNRGSLRNRINDLNVKFKANENDSVTAMNNVLSLYNNKFEKTGKLFGPRIDDSNYYLKTTVSRAKTLAKAFLVNFPDKYQKIASIEFSKNLENLYRKDFERFHNHIKKITHPNFVKECLQYYKGSSYIKDEHYQNCHGGLEGYKKHRKNGFSRYIKNSEYDDIQLSKYQQKPLKNPLHFIELKQILPSMVSFYVKNIRSILSKLVELENRENLEPFPAYLYVRKYVSPFDLCIYDRIYCSEKMEEYYNTYKTYPLSFFDVIYKEMSSRLSDSDNKEKPSNGRRLVVVSKIFDNMRYDLFYENSFIPKTRKAFENFAQIYRELLQNSHKKDEMNLQEGHDFDYIEDVLLKEFEKNYPSRFCKGLLNPDEIFGSINGHKLTHIPRHGNTSMMARNVRDYI